MSEWEHCLSEISASVIKSWCDFREKTSKNDCPAAGTRLGQTGLLAGILCFLLKLIARTSFQISGPFQSPQPVRSRTAFKHIPVFWALFLSRSRLAAVICFHFQLPEALVSLDLVIVVEVPLKYPVAVPAFLNSNDKLVRYSEIFQISETQWRISTQEEGVNDARARVYSETGFCDGRPGLSVRQFPAKSCTMEEEANAVRVAVRIRPQLPKELIGRWQNYIWIRCIKHPADPSRIRYQNFRHFGLDPFISPLAHRIIPKSCFSYTVPGYGT